MKLQIILLLLCFTLLSKADDTRVAFDNNNSIFKITKSQNNKLKIFNDYEDFFSATIYKTDLNTYKLEILIGKNDNINRSIKSLSIEEYLNLKSRISILIAKKDPSMGIDRSGRSILVTNSTLMALIAYGPAIAHIADLESKNILATELIVGSIGFFAPLLYYRDHKITKGMAEFGSSGMGFGFIHPILVSGMFNIKNTKAVLAASIGFSLLECNLGLSWAEKHNVSYGRASTINLFSQIGFIYGSLIPPIIESPRPNMLSASMLLGNYLGVVTGQYLTRNEEFTIGDTRVMSTFATIGAVSALSVGPLLDAKYQFYFASATLGSMLGLYYGYQHTKKNDYTSFQGYMFYLSSIAGALAGGGLAILADVDGKAALPMIAAGSLLGSIFTLNILSTEIYSQEEENNQLTNLNISINPMALNNLIYPNKSQIMMPMVSLNYKF